MNKPYRGPGIRISSFQVKGPLIDEWPTESMRTTYDSEKIPNLADPKARQDVVLRFAKRAFRRNVNKDDVTSYVAFLERQHANGSSWHEATIKTFAAMMSSVDFLYIREERRITIERTQRFIKLNFATGCIVRPKPKQNC